jgi:hypothetical protein
VVFIRQGENRFMPRQLVLSRDESLIDPVVTLGGPYGEHLVLPGGWIPHTCLETLPGFLVAIGQLVDSHPGEVRATEVFVPIERAEKNSGAALDQCQSIFGFLILAGYGMLSEEIQQSRQDGVLEHGVGGRPEQPRAAGILNRRLERLAGECVRLARSHRPGESFAAGVAFEEPELARQDLDALFPFADQRLAGHSPPPSFFESGSRTNS